MSEKKSRATRYDWAAIERDYRTGQYSNRELARLHGPSEGAIRKRAADGNWQRDLSEQIRQRVREKTGRAIAQELVKAETDAEIVEQAAEVGAGIVRGHQVLLRKAKGLAETLMDRLETQLAKGTISVQLKGGAVAEIDIPLDGGGVHCPPTGPYRSAHPAQPARRGACADRPGEDHRGCPGIPRHALHLRHR